MRSSKRNFPVNARFLLAGFLALGAAQAAAQTSLNVPRSPDEMRTLLRESGESACLRCGVVTSARALDGASPGVGVNTPSLPGSSSTDTGLGVVPFGGEHARAERGSLRQGPSPRYEVIVRFDDGSYERVEVGQDPKLNRGDRVQVENGSVRRYP